ncbi:MAG: AbrB/MazE/SpoVT family DNA-binding domain-containing protein [Gammaproteobacteria bacterium]|nr:MAG: AbrB/MazE/SpoVT family DNA-binding domain-containing protein [Gammaproteobacteria bacterium]
MQTAKLFLNGNSQAVRFPKSYNFKTDKVYLKKVPQGVLLMPAENNNDDNIWDKWQKNLDEFSSDLKIKREQNKTQQNRAKIDELFA